MEHYLVAIAVTAGIYALMALGMNVIWGMAGLINLGLVGFFAVGAYASALLTLKLGMPIVVGMVAGAAAASVFGVLVALVTVRLRGDYLAIVTLGFAETLRIVMSNELWIANGTDGLSGIPGPFRGALGPHLFNFFYLGIVVAAVVVLFFLVDRLAHAPFGRVLRAIRDDEQIAQVAGKNVMLFKVKAFGFGTSALGFAGALYGHFTSYIARDLFAPLLTLYINLSLLAGGPATARCRARRRTGRLLSRVDALCRAVDSEPLGRPGRGAARAHDIRGTAGDPPFVRQRLDPGTHRVSCLTGRGRRTGDSTNMSTHTSIRRRP
jgi:branched-chain amino acid transport system permease protein